MKQANIPVPEEPFEYIRNATLKTAFMIFTGPKKQKATAKKQLKS